MSNWISITKQALYDSKAAAFIDAADSVQLGAGQTDRSTDAIADVVAEIRRKVARCNTLDQDPTKIPAGLKTLAADLIVARLKIALEQELTDDEKRNLDHHERELNRIADGKDLVDAPDNPIPQGMNQAQMSTQYKTGQRRFTGRELLGL
jgi:hypothetical protein